MSARHLSSIPSVTHVAFLTSEHEDGILAVCVRPDRQGALDAAVGALLSHLKSRAPFQADTQRHLSAVSRALPSGAAPELYTSLNLHEHTGLDWHHAELPLPLPLPLHPAALHAYWLSGDPTDHTSIPDALDFDPQRALIAAQLLAAQTIRSTPGHPDLTLWERLIEPDPVAALAHYAAALAPQTGLHLIYQALEVLP